MLRSCVVLNLAISILVDRLIANFAQEGTLARARTVISCSFRPGGWGSPDFGRSIFVCINAHCDERRIFQHLPGFIRLARFCTAPISYYLANVLRIFRMLAQFR